MHIYNNIMHSSTKMTSMKTLITHHANLCINVDIKLKSTTLQMKKHIKKLVAMHEDLKTILMHAKKTQKKYYN